MVYEYVITLQNKTARYIDNISVLLILLSLFFFINYQVRNGFTMLVGIATFMIVALLAWNLYEMFVRQKKVSFSRTLLICGVLWVYLPMLQWAGIPILALALLEKLAKNDLEIGFSRDEVVINNLIKRRFPWSAFNNILLKDDLLTMDFKNNRLIQRMTVCDDEDADEAEFNEYCRIHISTPL